MFAEKFPDAKDFFRDHFVANYCPLVFMEESGRNRTPDKLPASEKKPLEEACDQHLREIVGILQPEWLIGVVDLPGNGQRKRSRELTLRLVRSCIQVQPVLPPIEDGQKRQVSS